MTGVRLDLVERSSGEPVAARLVTELGPFDLEQIEKIWGPLRREGARRLLREQGAGAVPQHWSWDWRRKGGLLRLASYQAMGIFVGDEAQGLMIVEADRNRARLEPDVGRPLVYIDFIEAAPWNVKGMAPAPRYIGVGSRLVEVAIRHSLELEYKGRIGLHALPQAEPFYREICGMAALERDPRKENLRYLEMTVAQAKLFLGESSPGESKP